MALAARVARFFFVQHTKTEKIFPDDLKIHKIFRIAVCKVDKMAIKYTDIFQSKTLQNLSKLGFLVS
jgi:hypothetical protein